MIVAVLAINCAKKQKAGDLSLGATTALDKNLTFAI